MGDLRARVNQLLGAEQGARVGVGFVVRTVAAALASLAIAARLPLSDPLWAVVSAVVVIMPEASGSIATAVQRVVANLVGAGLGMAVHALDLALLPSLVLGLVAAAGACRLLRIDAAARTASVALVIVTLHDPFDVRMTSEARLASVVLGCLVALAVTAIAAPIERALAARHPPST
jgi:uncharacterized membrane protein YgaE (UPF0421/DUF939 family)